MVTQLQMPAPSPDPYAALADLLGKRRIFFGHQSVGSNIIDGLAQGLGEQAGLIRDDWRPPLQPGLLHARIGRNRDPLSKIDAFASILRQGVGAQCEFALFKFCYADVDGHSSPHNLFQRYAATMARLREEFPLLRLGHVTLPLREASPGPLGRARQLLGQATVATRTNGRRHGFNQLLLARYHGVEPVFDLATVESTTPDGARCRQRHRGDWIPALAPCYTDDGGHLNALGRGIVAEAFAEFLVRFAGPSRPDRR